MKYKCFSFMNEKINKYIYFGERNIVEYKGIEKPIYRSKLRTKAGMLYYGMLRKYAWIKMRKNFANKRVDTIFPYRYFEHKTPLMRKLKDVDMWLQRNKVKNLQIAVPKVNNSNFAHKF